MITRRSLFASFAALPFVGRLFSEPREIALTGPPISGEKQAHITPVGKDIALVSAFAETLTFDGYLECTTHGRDVPVKFGGGFVEGVSRYRKCRGGLIDTAEVKATIAGKTHLCDPEVEASFMGNMDGIEKAHWPAFPWNGSLKIAQDEVDAVRDRRVSSMGVEVTKRFKESVVTVWGKALDSLAYVGFQGMPGLLNNPNVPAIVVPNSSFGPCRRWQEKTPSEILKDIIFAVKESGGDTLLLTTSLYEWAEEVEITLPPTHYETTTLLAWLKHEITAEGIDLKIVPLADAWLAGQGIGGLNRALVYRNDPKAVYLHITMPPEVAMTMPAKDNGYEVIFSACVSSVIWLQPETALYLDGV